MNGITKTPTAAEHILKAPVLLSGWTERAAGNCIDTGKLLALGMNPQTWGEFFLLQGEALQRLLRQQQSWSESWVDWVREGAAIKGANTVTKFVEQEFNLAAQLGQLMADQATSLIALLENIDVAYAYWLSGKLGPLSHSQWHRP